MKHLIILILLWTWSLAALAGVNINTASQSELQGLPGIGTTKAAAIIEFRTRTGGFTTIDQLDDVPGIGPATMANLRPLVELGDGVAAPADPNAPSATPQGTPININSADASTLTGLPGIGATKAAAIIADREANGAFPTCDDLQRVKGVGKATVDALRGRCVTQ